MRIHIGIKKGGLILKLLEHSIQCLFGVSIVLENDSSLNYLCKGYGHDLVEENQLVLTSGVGWFPPDFFETLL